MGRKQSTSVARGMALCSILAAGQGAGRALQAGWPAAPGAPEPVCQTWVEDRWPQPSCTGAADRYLLRCADGASASLQTGDARLLPAPQPPWHSVPQRLPGGMRAAWRLMLGAPLDLNQVAAKELRLLDGVGPKLAGAVVAERKRRGRFVRVDELLRIRGVGPAKLSLLRPYVYIPDAPALAPPGGTPATPRAQ